MTQIVIKLPDETLTLTVSAEAAEGLPKWLDEASADDVFTATDQEGNNLYIQKRHMLRVTVTS